MPIDAKINSPPMPSCVLDGDAGVGVERGAGLISSKLCRRARVTRDGGMPAAASSPIGIGLVSPSITYASTPLAFFSTRGAMSRHFGSMWST